MNTTSLPQLAGLLFAVLLPAQDQGPQALAGLRVPVHTAEPDNGVPYGTWAAGDAYKASFHDGMTFVPYLGSDYPHNQPWSWRTTSVKVGAAELLDNTAPPLHHQQDYRYEYRFGAVTEAYDVRLDGLEQTFVVHQRPAVGDLVIRGIVTSQLHSPDVEAAHRALTFFDNEGRAILDYGEAAAFDANGDTVRVATAHRDGEITLTVPGAWLEQAALPVTVDPLLTRVLVIVTASTLKSIDIGREGDSATRNVMIVYAKAASQYDDDAIASLFNDDYSSGVMVYADTTSSWDTDGTCCAFVGAADRWAIVFRRYFGNAAIRLSRIRCHISPPGLGVFSSSYRSMATPSGVNDWRTDVGGVAADASFESDALVVFQRENNSNTAGHWANVPDSAIYTCLLDVTGSGTFATPRQLNHHVNEDNERPSVNQVRAAGTTQSWAVAWQILNRVTPNDDWDVHAREVTRAGVLTNSQWICDLGAFGTHHQLAPVISGQRRRYAVAFASVDVASVPVTSGSTGKEVRVERFDWLSPSPDYPTVVLASDASRIFEVGAIAVDGLDSSHFVVAYRTIFAPVNGAYGVRLGYRGRPTEGPFALSAVAGQSTTLPACTFDRDHSDFLFSYATRVSGSSHLHGQTLEYVTPTPWSNSGVGCSAATLTWGGYQQIGSQFSTVHASAAPVNAGHFVVVSLATADLGITNPGVASGCRLLVDAGPAYLGALPFRTGVHVWWEFPLPEWLPPWTLQFQDWILNGTAFESTQRLSVPIVK